MPYTNSLELTNSVTNSRVPKGQTQKKDLVYFMLPSFLQDNVEELSRALDLHTGIMGYVSKFWRGFFPILIIELENTGIPKTSSIEDEGPSQTTEVPKEIISLVSKAKDEFWIIRGKRMCAQRIYRSPRFLAPLEILLKGPFPFTHH